MLRSIGEEASATKIAFAESAEAIGLTTTQLSAFLGVAAGIAVIAGTIALVDALTVSYKEAREEWQASAQAYEDSASKVQSLEDELADVSKKIDDINAKDKIDPTDRDSLDKLKKTKLNLEEQLELEKKLASYRQAKAAKDAKTALDKGGSAGWDKESVFGIKGVADIDYINAGVKIAGRSSQGLHLDRYDQISETSAVQNAIDRLLKERQDLEDNYRRYIDSMSESEQKANRARVDKIDDLVTNLQEKTASNMSEIQEYLESITDADGNALKGYEDYVFRIEQLQHQISGIDVNPLDDAAAHVKEFQQLAKDGNWDSAELRHYIGLLSGQDLSTADVDKVKEAWNALKQTIGNSDWNVFNFLKGDETENLQQFWEAVQSINKEWASFDSKTGEWTINLTSVEALAESLGLSEDLVKSIIQKTSEAGIDIDTTPVDNVRHAIMETSEALDVLKAKKVDIDFNLDSKTVQEAEQSIDHVAKYIASLRDDKGKLNLDSQEVQAAYTIMSQLYDKKIELSNAEDITFKVNTEGISDDKVKTFINDINNAKLAIQELNKGKKLKAHGFDIDVGALKKKAQEAVGKVKESFNELPEDKKVKLSIKEEGVDQEHLGKTLKVLKQINEADCKVALGIDPALVEGYNPDDKEAEVKYSANYSAVTNSKPPTMQGTVKYYSDYTNARPHPGTNTRTHYQGNANASGTWGSDRDGDDLVGELGRELLVNVRTGRWQTIGDNGAEFTHVGKGDIIFNHKQTEQLLKYGHINSRGRALVGGNAYDVGITGKGVLGSPKPKDDDKPDKSTGNHVKTAATTVSKSVKDATDSIEKDTKNLVDWVEKVLENIDKKTEKYLAKAEKKAEAGNYSGAAKQYQKALNTYDKSIGKHGDAENLYMRQANGALSKAISSGTITKEMAATIQKRVANGAMDISKLSDGTKAVVDAYKEYYDKAVAAQEATQELYDKYEETAKKMYQLPLDQASAKTDKLKNSYEILEKKLDATTNATKQEALMEKQIANLRKQQAAASKAYDSAKSNYKGNKTKVNETTDKALSGLTDTMKAKVIAKVRENMVIDVTALTGLTAEGKQAILDYNASLVAQQDALQNLQVVNLDTAASVKELAASIADLPNVKAEKKIEKQDDVIAELDAAYAIAKTPAEQEKILNKLTQRAANKYDARLEARQGAQGNLDDVWEHSEFLRDRAERFGKQKGQKLSLKGLAEDSKEYELVAQYNAYIDALKKAEHEEKLAYSEYVQTKNANAEKLFENLQSSQSEDVAKVEKAIESAQHTVDNIDEAATKLMQIHPGITYAEAVEQAYAAAEATFRDAGQKYENFANILKDWLVAHEGELSPEQIGTIQNTIDGLYSDSQNAYNSADAAALSGRQYADQSAQRDLAIAQQHYDEIHQTNEKDKASGYNITPEAAEAEKQALQELIDKNDAVTQSLYAQRAAVQIGSDEWNRLNDEYNNSFNSGISLLNSMSDLNEEIQDIKFKPLNDQLEDLQNEADKTKDHMTFMQNLGMQPLISDYAKLIQNSRQQVDLLKQQRAELQAQLDAGGLTEAEYDRIEQEIRECDAAIRQAENDQAGWKKSAQDTVKNSISSVGDAMSSGANAVSQVSDKIIEMLKKIQQAMIDFRKRQINKIYRTLKRIDTKISTIQNKIAIQQELGQKVSADDYVQQASQLAAKIKQYDTELIPKLRQEYNIQKRHQHSNPDYDVMADPDGSKTKAAYEEWQSAVTELENLRLELIKLLNSDISSVLLEPLESAKKHLSDINGLLGSISKLITDDMLFDVDGNKTEQYTQKMALLAGQYRTVQEEVQATKNEIWGLSAYLASGQKAPDSFMEDYLDKWGELADVAESQKQIALEMVDAMREASEEEVDHLQEIIDARREALQSKKDYYEYDKTIRNKSKDIQALQAQIAALEGLADAESKAKRARLEADLATAQEDLDDTIQQHMFDLSDKALEDLGDALEKSHEEQWEKLVSSVDELLKYAAEFSSYYSDSDVSDSLESILRSYGIITGETSKQDATMISTLFRRMLSEANTGAYNKQTFDEAINGYNNAVEDLKKQGLLTDIATIATDTEVLVQAVEDRVNEESPQTSTNPEGKRSFYDQLKALFAGNSINGEQGGNPNALGELVVLPQTIALDFMEWTSGTKMEDWFWGGAEGREKREDEIAKSALDLLDRLKNVKIGNWNVFGKYATGSRRIKKDQLAWTQEHGKEEWIVRPSDGAILTPLSQDSGVLPPDITSKLWNLAEGNLPQMQMPKISLPDLTTIENNSPMVNIDSSINVEGSIDAMVVSDIKKLRDEMREEAYKYTSEKMYRGYIHSGGKRRL